MEKEQSRTEVIRGIRRMAAERFPGQTNSVQAQNALMEQLAAVVPPMRLCVAKAQRDYWPGVEKGQLSLQQAVQLCARDMNNMLRITKMQNLDLSGAGEAQLLDAWGALDYYSAKMDGSAAMQVQALYGKLADTLKEKIAERKAAEQAAAEQARRAEEARIAAEQARRAEEARIAAEQARRAEEARKAEEARVAAEQARRAEEARMAAEQARKAEEARAAAEPAWEELSFADAANVRAEEQDFTTVVVRDQLKKDEQISDIDWSSFETDRGPWVMEQENKVQGRTGKKRLPLILAAAAVLVVVAVVVILCAGPRGLSLEPYDLDWGMTMEEVTAQLDGVYRTNERKPDFLYVLNGDNEGSLEAFGALPDVVIYEFDLLKEGSDESRLGTVVLKFDESDYSKVLAALEKKYGKLYFEETMWGAENTNIYLYEDGLVYIEYDSAPLQDPKTISEDERSRYTTLCTMIYSNTHNLAELSHDGFARLWMYSTAESDFTIVDNRK